jgi:hypothetical protein
MRLGRVCLVILGMMPLIVSAEVAGAAERSASEPRYSGRYTQSKARAYRKSRPLEVTIYGRRRIGGYSYSAADVTSTYGRSPPPWLDVRQTPGGPFDSGFFFDSGMGLHGGNSPYLH